MKTSKAQRTMTQQADEYLLYRRAMGYQLKIEGRQLLQFARYVDDRGHHGPITLTLALDWATLPTKAAPLYRARRLEVVRCFARYCALFDPATEIPPQRLLGSAHRRNVPYLYSVIEQRALLTAAQQLSPVDGLRPHTYATLLGLLICTGLRISEALHLRCEDVDWQQSLLAVRQTKFRKSRLVPVHPSALQALRLYVKRRDQLQPLAKTNHFFLSDAGAALTYSTVRYTFGQLRSVLSVPTARKRPPRLHDFRHGFACQRLLAWYRDGVDVTHTIAALATYLGHTKVTDTYWYLTATPELLALATDRFQKLGNSPKGGQP